MSAESFLNDAFLTTVLARHLVHASDAEQAEALLSRWGPEGQGKLGGEAYHWV